jgi:hypothetical protein
MPKLRTLVTSFALVVLTLACASAARAQATRTWVSGVGDDVNPCSRTAPCKTFAGAISKTATGGEISVLDPGGYGTLTITKAITVDGGTGAGWGSTLSSGVSGAFIINITTNLATDKVILRNLSINGAGTTLGVDGIRFLDGAELTVENVVMQNFSGDGIEINQGQTSITNIRNVTMDRVGAAGVKATTSAGEAIVLIDNSRIRATSEGVHAIANCRFSVRDTIVTHATTGIRTSGTNSIINADDNFVSFCSVGIQASAGSSINVSDTIIAQNSTGVSANGGAVNSFQGNSLINNTAPGAFSATTNKQ